jgi:hypothetical protein
MVITPNTSLCPHGFIHLPKLGQPPCNATAVRHWTFIPEITGSPEFIFFVFSLSLGRFRGNGDRFLACPLEFTITLSFAARSSIK